MIENPILPGFNPDPSIIRVNEDYYIATSTFEWLPGIQIHHSRDLKNWKLLTHALSQLDLTGVAPSRGVWAPSLSFDEKSGIFYLAYSLAWNIDRIFDGDNYLITAHDISGPWSEPVYLNSSGFDPSMFLNDDGKMWLLNLEWDFRKGYEHPGAIVIQEYSPEKKKLTGEAKRIYRGGTDMGCLEGPHLYRYNGYYYMMAAEGGTGYGHGVTMSRSKTIFGPYEPDPENPILTSAGIRFNERGKPDFLKPQYYNPNSYLQKSGHGSLVRTLTDEFYIAHLCSRPVMPEMCCMLGRETAIQKAAWTSDGWLRLAGGGNLAYQYTEQPKIPEQPFEPETARDDFDKEKPDVNFCSLRIPFDSSWATLSERRGYLRLRGRESLSSTHHQSLIARRIQSFHIQAETSVEFEPDNFQQMAGLVCFYDNRNHTYLRCYFSETLHCKCLGLMTSDNGNVDELTECRVSVKDWKTVYMRVIIHVKNMQFYYSGDGNDWKPIGPVLDASKLSDEYCKYGKFTGAFVGVCVQDLYRKEKWADFDYFEYINL